jgi:hypothetical protein
LRSCKATGNWQSRSIAAVQLWSSALIFGNEVLFSDYRSRVSCVEIICFNWAMYTHEAWLRCPCNLLQNQTCLIPLQGPYFRRGAPQARNWAHFRLQRKVCIWSIAAIRSPTWWEAESQPHRKFASNWIGGGFAAMENPFYM